MNKFIRQKSAVLHLLKCLFSFGCFRGDFDKILFTHNCEMMEV